MDLLMDGISGFVLDLKLFLFNINAFIRCVSSCPAQLLIWAGWLHFVSFINSKKDISNCYIIMYLVQ